MPSPFTGTLPDIHKRGKFVASHGLSPTQTAKTVRVRDGKTLTTDGPYVQTKEQLGAIYVIEASDINDAVQVASKIPSARFANVEVRPYFTYGQS
jgi:hypothetical protein